MRSNDSAVTVRKDVLMYMDVLQQECIQRKLEELIALQPARAAASSPKAHSPRAAAHSSSSSSSSLLSDAHLSWQLPSISEHDLPERKKTMPVHHHRLSAPGTPGTPVTTPPRSPRVTQAPALVSVRYGGAGAAVTTPPRSPCVTHSPALHSVPHALSPRSPAASPRVQPWTAPVQPMQGLIDYDQQTKTPERSIYTHNIYACTDTCLRAHTYIGGTLEV